MFAEREEFFLTRMSSEKTISIFSRPRAQNGFDYFLSRPARDKKYFARSVCRSHPTGGKAQSAAKLFQKKAIYGLFFTPQLLVANFSTLLGGLFARLLVS